MGPTFCLDQPRIQFRGNEHKLNATIRVITCSHCDLGLLQLPQFCVDAEGVKPR